MSSRYSNVFCLTLTSIACSMWNFSSIVHVSEHKKIYFSAFFSIPRKVSFGLIFSFRPNRPKEKRFKKQNFSNKFMFIDPNTTATVRFQSAFSRIDIRILCYEIWTNVRIAWQVYQYAVESTYRNRVFVSRCSTYKMKCAWDPID